MWGHALAGILAQPWARQAVGIGLAAVTIVLFLLNLRRTAERAGRAAEKLDQLERTHAIRRDMLDRPHAALVAATIFLTGCAECGSDIAPSACPPVVTYSATEQRQVAREAEALSGEARSTHAGSISAAAPQETRYIARNLMIHNVSSSQHPIPYRYPGSDFVVERKLVLSTTMKTC